MASRGATRCDGDVPEPAVRAVRIRRPRRDLNMERKLKVERRDGTGKGSARKLRAAGKIPGVVYGRGSDPILITADARELFHVLHTEAGMNVLVELGVDGDELLAMPREIQRDHLRAQFKHVDFLRIARDEK